MKNTPKLHNTVERQRAQYIYDTYFNPDSEHVLDFGFMDTLEAYNVIDREETTKRTEDFERWGDNLLRAMGDYDKKLLKDLQGKNKTLLLLKH